MKRRWLARAAAGVALVVVVALGGAATAEAQGAIGLIYMNGKQAPTNTPGSNDIASKAAWRASRSSCRRCRGDRAAGRGTLNSVTPDQVFAMIDGYANQLRAQGAQRIVVGGTSLGANVALAYAVARQNVAGVVMAAPWHNPRRFL